MMRQLKLPHATLRSLEEVDECLSEMHQLLLKRFQDDNVVIQSCNPFKIMAEILTSIDLPPPFPDHTQLPDEDGTFVKNFQKHPQSLILTDSIGPVLQRLHPDGQYCIGQDCGIYWRETDPPEKGAEAPNWFYIPSVPPNLDGEIRRSYVLWREFVAPLMALEFASGDGSEERDKTPLSRTQDGKSKKPGKFWVVRSLPKNELVKYVR